MKLTITGIAIMPGKGEQKAILIDPMDDSEFNVEYLNGMTFVQFRDDIWVLEPESVTYKLLDEQGADQ